MKLHRKTTLIVIATFMSIALTNSAWATNYRLRAVEASYRAQHHQLHARRKAKEEAARCMYRDSIKALNFAQREAHRLCQPHRSRELDAIRFARKSAGDALRSDLLAARAEHDIAWAQLKAWRVAARHAARVQVCSANVHTANVYRIDTYEVPQGVRPAMVPGPIEAVAPSYEALPPYLEDLPPAAREPTPALAPTPAQEPTPAEPLNDGEGLIFPGGGLGRRTQRGPVNVADLLSDVLRIYLAQR